LIRPAVADYTKSGLGSGHVVAASFRECIGASQIIPLATGASTTSITAGRVLAHYDSDVTVEVMEIYSSA
jgi:hypothetical protein